MGALQRRTETAAIGFDKAAEAWFWTMAIVLARQDGAGLGWRPDGPERPCDPEDITACLDSLYRDRMITLAHARVIRDWGERQREPASIPERDHRLWHQAMGLLEWRLRARSIVR